MRFIGTAFLVAALAVAARARGESPEEKAEAAAAAARDPNGATDPQSPPPGAPADQALWTAGLETTNTIQLERSRASRLQLVLANLRYVERLRILRARGGAEGERAGGLEKRVNESHAYQFATLTSQWPVDPYRGCGYPAMEFGSMMGHAKSDPEDLEKHRAILRRCVEQGRAAVKFMKESNDQLEAALRDADAALRAAGLGAPTSGLAAAGAKPAPAAREEAAERREGREENEAREKRGARRGGERAEKDAR